MADRLRKDLPFVALRNRPCNEAISGALSDLRRERDERPDPRRPPQLDLKPPGQRPHARGVYRQRHRLVQGRGHDPPMPHARRTLVVLLDEESSGHAAIARLELELDPEQVRLPATE